MQAFAIGHNCARCYVDLSSYPAVMRLTEVANYILEYFSNQAGHLHNHTSYQAI